MVTKAERTEFASRLLEKLESVGLTFGSVSDLDRMCYSARKAPSISANYHSYKSETISKMLEADEIEFNTPLEEIPKKHLADVLSFVAYLSDTANRTFKIKGFNSKTGEHTEKEIPYVHRWTEIYRKGLLAKLYQLEHYLGEECENVTMITLTVSQRDSAGKNIDPEECLRKLKKCYTKLIDCMRKFIGTTDYFYTLEPHKTGYPHMHMMYMARLTEQQKSSIINLWSKKYGAGSELHGINFSEPRSSSNDEFKSGSVSRVKGYLMKYITKGIYSKSMSKAELLFNSLLKKTKTRLWNCSRNFSAVMRRPEKEQNPHWECTQVSQWRVCHATKDQIEENPNIDKHKQLINIVWDKEIGLRPEVIKDWKHVLTVPTWCYGTKAENEDKLHGCKIEEVGEFTRIYEPVWRSVDSFIN